MSQKDLDFYNEQLLAQSASKNIKAFDEWKAQKQNNLAASVNYNSNIWNENNRRIVSQGTPGAVNTSTDVDSNPHRTVLEPLGSCSSYCPSPG